MGHMEKFFSCILRHPLEPGGQPHDSQSYHIFHLAESKKYVLVGANDGFAWPPKKPLRGAVMGP